MNVAGCRESQTWCAPGQTGSSSSETTSSTSQRSGRPSSRIDVPIKERTVLLAPSQPSTARARTDRSAPLSRSTAVTSTVVPSWLRPVTSTPRTTVIRGRSLRGRRQFQLEVGLVHQRALWPPVHPGRRVARELGEHPVGAVQQAEARHRPAARRDRVGDARVLEDAEDLVVQVDGAGQRIGGAVLLEHEDVEPPVGQQEGGGQADRAGPHHDHGRVGHALSVADAGGRPGLQQVAAPRSPS